MIDTSKLILIAGFPRGGTTWLRHCVGSHPGITQINKEITFSSKIPLTREHVISSIEEKIRELKLQGECFVNKAPVNSLVIDQLTALFPESKFLFIIRDPRDQFVSYRRGSFAWMHTKTNESILGVMGKAEQYYKTYYSVRDRHNIMLVQYENLHQDFHAVMETVFQFVGVPCDGDIIDKCYRENNFPARTGRRFVEDRDHGFRKGVVGDWPNYLEKEELDWVREQSFWWEFMKTYGYDWNPLSYEGLLQAMKDGGVVGISWDEFLNQKMLERVPKGLFVHLVEDNLTSNIREKLVSMAKLENKCGFTGIYNFLQLTSDTKIQAACRVIEDLKKECPEVVIGLAIDELNHKIVSQVEDFSRRGRKIDSLTLWNGSDFMMLGEESISQLESRLSELGVQVVNRHLQKLLKVWAVNHVKLSICNGTLSMVNYPNNGSMTKPETFQYLPEKSLISVMIQQAGLGPDDCLNLGLRVNIPRRKALQ